MRINTNKKIMSSLLVVGLLGLNGCGGSGEGIAQNSLGNSIKGTSVSHARIAATKPDSTPLAQSTTHSEKGVYKLDLKKYTGPVVLNVTCEENSFFVINGVHEACPKDTELHAIANVNGKDTAVNVSPLTEVIYQKVENEGISEENINKISNQVSMKYGVNPTKNNPTTGLYAEIVKAFIYLTKQDQYRAIDDVAHDLANNVDDAIERFIHVLDEQNIVINMENDHENSADVSSGEAHVKAFIKDLRTQAQTTYPYLKQEAKEIGYTFNHMTLHIQTASNTAVKIIDMIQNDKSEGMINGVSITIDHDQNGWHYDLGGEKGDIAYKVNDQKIDATFNGVLQQQQVKINVSMTKEGEDRKIELNGSIEKEKEKIEITRLTGALKEDGSIRLNVIEFQSNIGNYDAKGKLFASEYVQNKSLQNFKAGETVAYDIKKNNNGFIPEKLVFLGDLKNRKSKVGVNGTIDVDFLNAKEIKLIGNKHLLKDLRLKVDMSGKLIVPNQPNSLINLNYRTLSDGKHSIVGSYIYDTTLLSVDGSIDNGFKNGKLIFTDGSDIEAVFRYKDGKLIKGNMEKGYGSLVFQDGKMVGYFERSKGLMIIHYLSGDYETLF
jgi:hypothetical protein